MARVRSAVPAALLLALLVVATAAAAVPRVLDEPLAAVVWPPSTGLVVAEVVTGGISASDEYIELANAGAWPADLSGLEVAYATSSGATVTRKATWTASLVLAPGQHLLIANSAGVYAPLADALYSSGLAATGGAIVLRASGGSVVDAVGWGDAVNTFVEGTAAPAPAAGQSIERLPGGAGGNAVDTNSNRDDFVVNASPSPQNLAALPVPQPTASPTPTSSPTPSDDPTPPPDASATPLPTPSESPSPAVTDTPSPTVTDTPSPTPTTPTPTPTPTPTATPEPTSLPTSTPAPTASPTVAPSPSPSPTPSAMPIAEARALADGSTATIEGVLTTPLGALEAGRTGFLQDATGGIALYLDAAVSAATPAGTVVRATGTIASRYGQRTLRVAAADVLTVGTAPLPIAVEVDTGAVGEGLEGVRIGVSGVVTEVPTSLSDGLGVTLDDGSGPTRLVVAPDALGDAVVTSGMVVAAVGPLGQRDSSGTGAGGYRLYATLPGEFAVVPTPTPTPTASPAPTDPATPTPTATPQATPTATPAPTTSPSPSPAGTPSSTPSPRLEPVTIAGARAMPTGSTVLVRGVVLAEAGRLGTPALLSIGDATGGLPVRLADGMSAPGRGMLVDARGVVAAPYGQTELRLVAGGLTVVGTDVLPDPLAIGAKSVAEAVEGRLVWLAGTVSTGATRSTSGDLVLVVTGADGATLRVYADASARLDPAALKKGLRATFTGIVGQHASRKGALDGYRLWLRDAADVVPEAATTPAPTPTPPSTHTSAPPSLESIAAARVRDGATVTVEGVVTADRTLLDSTGRRTVLQDASGAIELYLSAPDASIRPGVRLRATGMIGRAWGAPRLHAASIVRLGTAPPAVRDLHAIPGPATEWELVRITGTVTSVHRTGDRWVAEIATASGAVPVVGLAGSKITPTAITGGRAATIVGIVKRPLPTASDRRYAVVPRAEDDIVLAAPSGSPDTSAGTGGQGSANASAPVGDNSAAVAGPTTDLRDIARQVGQRVHVGGVVTAGLPDGFRLDDGTATARVVLDGEAADLAAVIGPGDALDAVGLVEDRGGAVIVVRDPRDLVLVGDLGAESGASADAPAMLALAAGSGGPALGIAAAPARSAPGAAVGGLLATIAAGAVALLFAARRVRDRRRTGTRIQGRLAVLAAASAGGGTPSALRPTSATAAVTGNADA